MKKQYFTIFLLILVLFCICGCSNELNDDKSYNNTNKSELENFGFYNLSELNYTLVEIDYYDDNCVYQKESYEDFYGAVYKELQFEYGYIVEKRYYYDVVWADEEFRTEHTVSTGQRTVDTYAFNISNNDQITFDDTSYIITDRVILNGDRIILKMKIIGYDDEILFAIKEQIGEPIRENTEQINDYYDCRRCRFVFNFSNE